MVDTLLSCWICDRVNIRLAAAAELQDVVEIKDRLGWKLSLETGGEGVASTTSAADSVSGVLFPGCSYTSQ
jgi:hypothetical protein